MAVFRADGTRMIEREDWGEIRAIMSESNKVSGLLANSRCDPDNVILRHRLQTAALHAERVRKGIARLLEQLPNEETTPSTRE